MKFITYGDLPQDSKCLESSLEERSRLVSDAEDTHLESFEDDSPIEFEVFSGEVQEGT